MKRIYTFLATVFITALAFSAVLYSSCSKNKCSGVTCYNGGYCSGGTCNCPVGYSGLNCENSSIIFQNNTFTPINISVNGTNGTILAGQSVAFSGPSGSTAAISASTSGTNSLGVQVGELVSWNYNDQFPTGGNTLTDPLNVDNSYFFLQINNQYTAPITSITVNYSISSSYTLTDFLTIPANGATYNTGYYYGFSNTNVYFTYADNSNWTSSSSLAIPNVVNASYNLAAY